VTLEHDDPLDQMAHALDLHKKHIERCEEALRKMVEGTEPVRDAGLREALAILNERRKEPPMTGWDTLSDADKAEWAAMIHEQRDPETRPCSCGYPEKDCIRVVLRNGPPYPPRPCEPKYDPKATS
jgi:hypothetical protein